MKLLWYLGDWWLWTFFLFALLVMPVMAEGTWSALPVIASLALVLFPKPDFQKYQLVGLGSRIWNEHRRILIALFTIGAAVGALTVQLWWALPVYAVAAVRAMYRSATPKRSGYTTTGTQPSSGFGWFPRTLAGQAIYHPQAKAWCGACLAQMIGLVLHQYRDAASVLEFLGTFIWVLTVLLLAAVSGSLRKSLREYTVMGGSRRNWARHTAVLGLIPVFAAISISAALTNDSELVTAIALLSATCAPVLVTLEFLGKKNWHLFILYAVLIAGIVVIYAQTPISVIAKFFLAVAFYAVWALTLPSYIRRANVHGGGISGWLGTT